VHFTVLFCIFFLLVLLLLAFPSFAVLLNFPYPDTQVLPFSFHSSPHPSWGRDDSATAWSFFSCQGQTTTKGYQFTSRDFVILWPSVGALLDGEQRLGLQLSWRDVVVHLHGKVLAARGIQGWLL